MMSGTPLGGTGWMVVLMMGIGLLLVFGLIVWVVWMQRGALGLGSMQVGGQQMMSGGSSNDASVATHPTEPVERIARRRYASGEIDSSEYQAIMKTLREQ